MISGKNKQLYYESSIDKQLNIEVIGTQHVIDNSMREQDTFTLTETLNDDTELRFGACLPNQISFTGRDIPLATKGMKLRPVETLEGNENDPFVYGTYTVQSDIPTADRTKRQITAYDAMYDIINADVKSWYDGLTFPMTLKAFRDSFFTYLHIGQKEISLVNDGLTVNKTLVTSSSEDSAVTAESTISGKTIIEAICEINGAFGNINREGKFEYVILQTITSSVYPAEDLYPRDDLFPSDSNAESMTGHYITFDYENFQSKAITQLEIRADDNTAGAIVGTAGNTYVISGNFLVSDKTGAELEQIANNVLPIMAQAEYTPIKSSECVGNPCLELGDPIRFNTSREIVETYLLQRTLTGVQSKRDSIVSPGTEYHSNNLNTMRDKIERIRRRTNNLERTADHTLSELADLDENTSSRFEQTANAITAEVAARQGADAEMSTKISQTAHSIGLTASGGEQSVGIIIQLFDENGNVIDTSSGNANITITGVVRFTDLAQAGATVINGSNITTGIIKSSDSEFTRAKFYDGIYYALNYGGSEYVYPVIVVTEPGQSVYGVSGMHTTVHGSVVFDDSVKRVYLGSMTANHRVATIGDIPSTSGFLTRSDISGFITGITVNDRGNSAASAGKYTAYLYLAVGSSGTYSSVSGYHILASDRRMKDFVTDAPDIAVAYMGLRPVHFKFKDNADGVDQHWHYGFIAQEVKDAFDLAGISTYGEALVGHDEENDMWLLDKSEMHAMHVQMIQKQQREIEQLKKEIDVLKQKVGDLSNVILSKNNQF